MQNKNNGLASLYTVEWENEGKPDRWQFRDKDRAERFAKRVGGRVLDKMELSPEQKKMLTGAGVMEALEGEELEMTPEELKIADDYLAGGWKKKLNAAKIKDAILALEGLWNDGGFLYVGASVDRDRTAVSHAIGALKSVGWAKTTDAAKWIDVTFERMRKESGGQEEKTRRVLRQRAMLLIQQLQDLEDEAAEMQNESLGYRLKASDRAVIDAFVNFEDEPSVGRNLSIEDDKLLGPFQGTSQPVAARLRGVDGRMVIRLGEVFGNVSQTWYGAVKRAAKNAGISVEESVVDEKVAVSKCSKCGDYSPSDKMKDKVCPKCKGQKKESVMPIDRPCKNKDELEHTAIFNDWDVGKIDTTETIKRLKKLRGCGFGEAVRIVQAWQREAEEKMDAGAGVGESMPIDPLDALFDKIILGEDVTLDEITTTASVPGYEVPLGARPMGSRQGRRMLRKRGERKTESLDEHSDTAHLEVGDVVGVEYFDSFTRKNQEADGKVKRVREDGLVDVEILAPGGGTKIVTVPIENVMVYTQATESIDLSECISSGRLYIAPQDEATPEKPIGAYVDLNAPLPASILFGNKASILGSNKEFIDPNAFSEGQIIGVVENVDGKQLDEILKNMQDARSIWHVYRPSGYITKTVGAVANEKIVSPDPNAKTGKDDNQSPELSQLPEKADPKDKANIVYFRPSGNSMSDVLAMHAVGLAGRYFQLLDDLERCDEGSLQNRLSLQEAMTLLTYLGKPVEEIEKFRDAALKRIFKAAVSTELMVEALMNVARAKLLAEEDRGAAVVAVETDDEEEVHWGDVDYEKRPTVPLTPEQQQLVMDNSDLAIEIAKFNEYKGRGVAYTPDEVMSDAYFGLVKAAQRFDPSLGKSFRSYATSAIHNELQRGQAKAKSHLKRVRPVGDALADIAAKRVGLEPEDPEAVARAIEPPGDPRRIVTGRQDAGTWKKRQSAQASANQRAAKKKKDQK